MPNNITLPQLIIFGVESAICTFLYEDYAYRESNESVPEEYFYYADAHPIFNKLKQKGVSITFVFDFKHEGRDLFFLWIERKADTFLKISQLDKYVPDTAKWWKYPERESDEFKDEKEFETTKIYNEKHGSCEQINMLHKETGIPYSEMLFFDADNSTVQDIEKRMGIAVHIMPEKRRRRKLDFTTVIGSGIEEYIKVRNKYFQPTTVDTRSYWKKLETILPNNTTLPRLMIFGLESIIGTCLLLRNKINSTSRWPWSVRKDTTIPIYPFTRNIRNNRVFDNVGNELHYALEAHEIFQTLSQKGVGITFVFNCKAYVGKDFLEKSQLDKYVRDEAKWWSHTKDIYYSPSFCESCEYKILSAEEREKPEHIITIHERTQIPYSEMLFLDGDNSTVRDIMGRTGMVGYVIPKQTSEKFNLITVIAAGIRKYSEIRNEQFQLTTATTKTS